MNDFGRLLEKEIPRLRGYAFALARNMSQTTSSRTPSSGQLPNNIARSGVPTFAPGSSRLCITRT
jgi:hypothetical protein